MSGKLIRSLLWLGLAVLLAVLAAVGWLGGQALSEQPRVPARQVQPGEYWQGRVVADYLLFPGRRGGVPNVSLDGGQVELALNYLLTRARLGQARVRLMPDALRVDASLMSPLPALGRFLNAGVVLRPAGQGLGLSQLVVGDTELPTALSRHLVRLTLELATPALDPDLVDRLLAGMSLNAGADRTTLKWRGTDIQSVLARARGQLLGLDEGRLRAYQQALSELAARRPRPGFAQVLGDLFDLARQRSAQGDPAQENRALLIALAEQVNGLGLGGGQSQPVARLSGLRLAGRGDFVEHLTLSAALAAVAGGEVAHVAGLMKEVGDSELGGSGFSFTDLAVDRAGTRLGHLAVASAAAARKVQAMLAGQADEALFLPQVRDLPEFLPQAEFKRRFGGVNGAGYADLVREIDRRIDALPVHRPAPG